MVFGGINRERLQLNEDTLWAGGPYDPVNPQARETLPEVRRLVFEGKYREAAKLSSAIGSNGQLQEWLEDWDAKAPEQKHRHISHLYGLFPSAQITPRGTPELANAAKVTLNTRGDITTGWAIVLFEWRVSRSREGPEEFLKSFRGKLQTDGYAAYESLAKERDDLMLVGCWAHCRRGFHEALAESKLAAWFVRRIGHLYAVEKELRLKKAGPRLRAAVRGWQSRPVLQRLHRAMELVRRRTLPQGLLGQAIDYALKRWDALNRFVEEGVLEIDTNSLENSIRPSALGKKNWWFVGPPEAGERSAVIYTLLGSCRRHGVNPFDYLKDLFMRLPAAKITQIKEFTPAAWAKARAKERVVAEAA